MPHTSYMKNKHIIPTFKRGTTNMIMLAMVAIMAVPTHSVLAFCAPFWPETRTFFPENNMHVFINHENGREDMVVQPAFAGNVEDFGLVVAVPSEPTLDEAPTDIFDDLEDYTNPFINKGMAARLVPSAESYSDIEVIRREFIGDFFTTIFKADSVSAMINWLDEYDYTYSDDDVANFAYYINSDLDYHFIALRVNTQDVNTDANGNLSAKLNPIEISFPTNTPIAPTRIMKGDMGQVSITLYTLSNTPLYIPGVDTQFAKKVTNESQEWMTEYNALNKTLVRQRMNINTNNIVRDEILQRWNGKALEIGASNAPFTLGTRSTTNGIFAGNAPTYTGVQPPVNGGGTVGYNTLLNGSRLLKWGSNGQDVRELQKFINNYVLTPGEIKLLEDGIWGPKTNQGVRTFQTRFNILIDGVVGPQTRGMLRNFLNDIGTLPVEPGPGPYPVC